MRYASVRRLEVFENPWKDARKFWQPDRPPKTQPISVGMFHGLPSRPCRGSSEEIFQPEPSGILVGCLVERCSEVLAARSGPKTQPISVGMFHGLPSRPCRGSSEEIFEPEPGGILVGCLVPTLPARCHGEQHVEANVCLPFVCFAYKTAWRTLCSSL